MANNLPESQLELNLTKENVVEDFLKAFSNDRLPDEILYNGKGYNLTKAYEKFWSRFCKKPGWLGIRSKVPQLCLEEVYALPKIIKRGWQDERYFPTKISKPFLEACIFKKENQSRLVEDISCDLFLGSVDVNEEKIIKKLMDMGQSALSEDCLEILQKYCPQPLSSGESLKLVCINMGCSVMSRGDSITIVENWNKELEDLMTLKEFNFLMSQRKQWESRKNASIDYDDISEVEEKYLPHRMWQKFYYQWSKEQIDFYLDLLSCKGLKCYKCESKVRSKHILGNDHCSGWKDMNTERHDSVLDIIEKKIKKIAKQKDNREKSPFFSLANDWDILRRCESRHESYTEEKLGVEFDCEDEKPHLIVYSMKKRKVMVVEVSIMWEEWKNLSLDQRMYKTKREVFSKAVKKLELQGFEVFFKDIEIGSRGVFCENLYDLFKINFGMNHSETSKTMEKISKEIIEIPWKLYKRRTLKRKSFE